MNKDYIEYRLLMVGLIGLLFVGMIGIVLLAITITDSITLEKIGSESVPCIDKYNRPFQDELCEKQITCSKLGWAGDKKCSEVQNEGERKE